MATASTLEQETTARSSFGRNLTIGSRARAELALSQLYESLGKPKPAVVWCRSIYQLITLPSLLIAILHSDIWQLLSGVFFYAEDDDSPVYREALDDAWADIWSRTGCLLLNGMKRSSRIAQHEVDVEPSAVLQCKGQMLAWARSGQLNRFEDKLNRQMYRRMWTRHLCDSDFAVRHLRSLTDKLDYELGREGHFLPQKMRQATPYFEQLTERYNTLERSIKGLVATMGAEPTIQLSRAIWLPTSISSVVTADLWRSCVNAEAFANYTTELDLWTRISESVLGMVCLDDVVFVCEQPQVLNIDSGGRLHGESGPALKFADESAYYIWHGVKVEQRIIEEPESITLSEIETTRNLEIRRILIERFGQSRFLQESGAEIVQEDQCGILYRQAQNDDEALVMVKVINSTPEPDGSVREYFLRVPPQTSTAREAVAWTFGLQADEYEPDKES